MNKSIPVIYSDHPMGVAVKVYRLKNKSNRLHIFITIVLALTLIITTVSGGLYWIRTAGLPAAPAATDVTSVAVPAMPAIPEPTPKKKSLPQFLYRLMK